MLKPVFEQTHPYHLAVTLGRSFRDRRKLEAGADADVRRYLRKNKSNKVPPAEGGLKGMAAHFFASATRVHVA